MPNVYKLRFYRLEENNCNTERSFHFKADTLFTLVVQFRMYLLYCTVDNCFLCMNLYFLIIIKNEHIENSIFTFWKLYMGGLTNVCVQDWRVWLMCGKAWIFSSMHSNIKASAIINEIIVFSSKSHADCDRNTLDRHTKIYLDLCFILNEIF